MPKQTGLKTQASNSGRKFEGGSSIDAAVNAFFGTAFPPVIASKGTGGDVEGGNLTSVNSVCNPLSSPSFSSSSIFMDDKVRKKVSQHFVQLSKNNAAKKIKALELLSEDFQTMSESSVSIYLHRYIDLMYKDIINVDDGTVRVMYYKVLLVFIQKEADGTNSMKMAISRKIGALVTCWLLSMHDPVKNVCDVATESMRCCFHEESKLKAALQCGVLEFFEATEELLEKVFTTNGEGGKGRSITEDASTAAMIVGMTFGATGYLLRYHACVSDIQYAVLGWLHSSRTGYLRRCLPSSVEKKPEHSLSVPRLHVAAINLLIDIIYLKCDLSQADYSLIWATAEQGIASVSQPTIVEAAWHLVLRWLGCYRRDAIQCMPQSFLSLVLFQLEDLHLRGDVVESLTSSQLPFLVILTADPDYCDVIDDFCGVLVESCKKRMGAKAHFEEYKCFGICLWECWNLHVLRKSAQGSFSDSVELLAVILSMTVNFQKSLWEQYHYSHKFSEHESEKSKPFNITNNDNAIKTVSTYSFSSLTQQQNFCAFDEVARSGFSVQLYKILPRLNEAELDMLLSTLINEGVQFRFSDDSNEYGFVLLLRYNTFFEDYLLKNNLLGRLEGKGGDEHDVCNDDSVQLLQTDLQKKLFNWVKRLILKTISKMKEIFDTHTAVALDKGNIKNSHGNGERNNSISLLADASLTLTYIFGPFDRSSSEKLAKKITQGLLTDDIWCDLQWILDYPALANEVVPLLLTISASSYEKSKNKGETKKTLAFMAPLVDKILQLNNRITKTISQEKKWKEDSERNVSINQPLVSSEQINLVALAVRNEVVGFTDLMGLLKSTTRISNNYGNSNNFEPIITSIFETLPRTMTSNDNHQRNVIILLDILDVIQVALRDLQLLIGGSGVPSLTESRHPFLQLVTDDKNEGKINLTKNLNAGDEEDEDAVSEDSSSSLDDDNADGSKVNSYEASNDDESSDDESTRNDSGSSGEDDLGEKENSAKLKNNEDNVLLSFNLVREVIQQLNMWLGILSSDSFKIITQILKSADEQNSLLNKVFWELLRTTSLMSPKVCIEQALSTWYMHTAIPSHAISGVTKEKRGQEALSVKGSYSRHLLFHSFLHKESVMNYEKYNELLARVKSTFEALDFLEKARLILIPRFFSDYIFCGEHWDEPYAATSCLSELLSQFDISPINLVLNHLMDVQRILDEMLPPSLSLMWTPKGATSNVTNTILFEDGVIPPHQMRQGSEGVSAALRANLIVILLSSDTSALRELFFQAIEEQNVTERCKKCDEIATLLVCLLRLCAVVPALSETSAINAREILFFSMSTLHLFQKKYFNENAEQEERKPRMLLYMIWKKVAIMTADNGVLATLGKMLKIYADTVHGDTQSIRIVVGNILTAICTWFIETSTPDTSPQVHATMLSMLNLTDMTLYRKDCVVQISRQTLDLLLSKLEVPSYSLDALVTYLHILRSQEEVYYLTAYQLESLMARIKKTTHYASALALQAELCCAPVVDAMIYGEICQLAAHLETKNYALSYLPTNGRLGQRIPGAQPIPLEVLKPIVLSLIKISDGLDTHGRRDDQLRISVILIVLDSFCDAIFRLKAATDLAMIDVTTFSPLSPAVKTGNSRTNLTTMTQIVHFIATITKYISSLTKNELSSVAASEQAVESLSNVFCYVHLWLSSISVAQIETLGIPNILQVLGTVITVALTALSGSSLKLNKAITIVRFRCLTARLLRKLPEHGEGRSPSGPLVTTFNTGGGIMAYEVPAKAAFFKKIVFMISKTVKQRLALLTWLASWAITLNNMEYSIMADSPSFSEAKQELYRLLDVVVAMLLTPVPQSNSHHIHQTVLWSAPDVFPVMNIAALGAVWSLAYLPLRQQSRALMWSLAQASTSILSMLIQSPLLSHVRSWMDTVDHVLASRLSTFIEKHISPFVRQQVLANVLSHSPTGDTQFTIDDDEKFTVSVNFSSQTVDLKYELDGFVVGMLIKLSSGFPIRLSPDMVKPSVSTKTNKWREWARRISHTLLQGASLWHAIEMLHDNINKNYEDAEECCICCSTLDHRGSIAEMECHTCHHKQHSFCLHKWWIAVGECKCPMCRTVWMT